MNEEIIKSGRGGKRAGASRPKGTTGSYKEKIKKVLHLDFQKKKKKP